MYYIQDKYDPERFVVCIDKDFSYMMQWNPDEPIRIDLNEGNDFIRRTKSEDKLQLIPIETLNKTAYCLKNSRKNTQK